MVAPMSSIVEDKWNNSHKALNVCPACKKNPKVFHYYDLSHCHF